MGRGPWNCLCIPGEEGQLSLVSGKKDEQSLEICQMENPWVFVYHLLGASPEAMSNRNGKGEESIQDPGAFLG